MELAFVVASVCKGEPTASLLLSLLIGTVVASTVRPGLDSVSVLLIIVPLSFVIGTVSMGVAAVALGFVINPLALIDIAISVVQLALPVSFVLAPLTFVARPIWPDLNAVAISHFVQPLPGVSCSVFQRVRRPSNSAILIDFNVTRAFFKNVVSDSLPRTVVLIVIVFAVGVMLQVSLDERVTDLTLCLLVQSGRPTQPGTSRIPHFNKS